MSCMVVVLLRVERKRKETLHPSTHHDRGARRGV